MNRKVKIEASCIGSLLLFFTNQCSYLKDLLLEQDPRDVYMSMKRLSFT